MNVRIFWVRAMKCMCAQTRPRFILSSEGVFWGNGVWTHVNSKGKIPSTGKCPQRRIEPATLWTASPSTINWAIPAPVSVSLCLGTIPPPPSLPPSVSWDPLLPRPTLKTWCIFSCLLCDQDAGPHYMGSPEIIIWYHRVLSYCSGTVARYKTNQSKVRLSILLPHFVCFV